ncbi:uncharacterized protein N7484_006858 [Penicillium longicatenatum]|uniref:uncharacterized protein n=1 Tax=Penicillium longicatenatum TaxID=1561947 RepID=UPI0025492EA9|nr:uncharacterized protein N7484_006858 [Penicillium longicatenatum]KAJ5638996.1 hypothetical protein N7484_006858 [Penicillium longicatenatum]
MAAPQIFVDVHTARICEEVERMHIRKQAETCAQIYPEQKMSIWQPPKGGIGILTLPILKGKLNRAVGCGSDGPIQEDDLRELESIFATIGLGCEIHLSPFASAPKALLSRGYTERAVLSTYWYNVREWAMAIPDRFSDIVVRLAEPYETKQFIEASIAGFQSTGRSRELLGTLAELAVRRKDMLFFAEVDGQVAGTAAMATIDTPDGRVAHFYLDSTIESFRGQGVQLALIQERLRTSHQLKLEMATSITQAGGGSARNAARAGFRGAYITPIFVGPRAS